MKRILILLAAAVISAAAFTGCGVDNMNDPSGTTISERTQVTDATNTTSGSVTTTPSTSMADEPTIPTTESNTPGESGMNDTETSER